MSEPGNTLSCLHLCSAAISAPIESILAFLYCCLQIYIHRFSMLHEYLPCFLLNNKCLARLLKMHWECMTRLSRYGDPAMNALYSECTGLVYDSKG